MTKRAAEETSPSMGSCGTGPYFFGYYRRQVEELVSQEETIPRDKLGDTKKYSSAIIGAELSDLKKEKLNALLRQCVCDSITEAVEIHSRVDSMQVMSQLSNKKPATAPTNSEPVIHQDPKFKEMEDDMRLLMKSDPNLVKEIVSKHSSDLTAKMNNMQQQLEKMLDSVVTTCRPMTRGEKRELMKSIKELPGENLQRVVGIIQHRYAALGKEMPDRVTINLEVEDNILLWRLYYYVVTVKRAGELDS